MTDRKLVIFQSNGAMMNLTMLNLSRKVLFSILLNLFLQVDTRSFPCGSGGLGELGRWKEKVDLSLQPAW